MHICPNAGRRVRPVSSACIHRFLRYSDLAPDNKYEVIPAPSKKKKSGGESAKSSWASQDEWNKEKRGYEWLFAFINQNRDGQIDPAEYNALQDYKKKHGKAWEGQARKELETIE